MASSDQMLGELYPQVESWLRQGRKGNPLEVAAAIVTNKLTQVELEEQLHLAGVLEMFNGLKDEKVKELVAKGVFRIWAMKCATEGLKEEDKKKLGEIRELKEPLENGSRIINERSNYQPEAVKSLVTIATSPDRKTRLAHANTISYLTENHLKGLDYAGGLYSDYSKTIPSEESQLRDRVTRYLLENRPESVRGIRNVSKNLMENNVVGLVNMPSESK